MLHKNGSAKSGALAFLVHSCGKGGPPVTPTLFRVQKGGPPVPTESVALRYKVALSAQSRDWVIELLGDWVIVVPPFLHKRGSAKSGAPALFRVPKGWATRPSPIAMPATTVCRTVISNNRQKTSTFNLENLNHARRLNAEVMIAECKAKSRIESTQRVLHQGRVAHPLSSKAYTKRVPRSSRSLFCAAKGGRVQWSRRINQTRPI